MEAAAEQWEALLSAWLSGGAPVEKTLNCACVQVDPRSFHVLGQWHRGAWGQGSRPGRGGADAAVGWRSTPRPLAVPAGFGNAPLLVPVAGQREEEAAVVLHSLQAAPPPLLHQQPVALPFHLGT